MSNLVYDALIARVPPDRKRTPGGWTSFNGPCCINNGQGRPDTRKRAGIRMTPEGSCVYHCFNCSYTTTWMPGRSLSKRMLKLIEWMGMPEDELKKLNFKIWQLKENAKLLEPVIREFQQMNFNEVPLPDRAQPLNYWLERETQDKNFLAVLEYLVSRGENLIEAADYHWTPCRDNDLNRRLIIPFKWQGKNVGWTARAIFPTKYRYFMTVQPNYIFNTEVVSDSLKYLFLNEGPFDGLAIHGLGFLGNHISPEQIQWVQNTGKIPIVVPDREKGGGALVDVAIQQGWYVSFPKWDPGVKDAADAVKKYGRLYTIWTIIDAMTNNRLQINIERQRLK